MLKGVKDCAWPAGWRPELPRRSSLVVPIIGSPYRNADVVVDPWLNGGQPTVAKRGIRVADILSRLNAHEPAGDVADNYGLTIREVEDIRKAA